MRLVGSFLIGSAGFVGVAVAVAWISNTALPTPADAARVDPPLLMEPVAPEVASVVVDEPSPPPVYTVMDVRNFRTSGAFAPPRDWLFDPAPMVARPPAVAAAPGEVVPPMETVSTVPLPMANPLFAGRVMPGDEPEDTLTLAPRPPRKPDAETQLAALPPPMAEDEMPDETAPPAATEAPEAELRYPTAEDKFAIYDIGAKKLHLPGGRKLEAHSGYGDKFDDVRYVHVKMRGPTPPNRYKLRMREALFHGTEAVRMTPVGDGKMYGRTGFLLHPYLLGPRGDSNGCISLADYDTFLAAFKEGQVEEVIVVEAMPKSAEPANPLLSWLAGKRS
ncbi:DUF2778 domain-containing protein [Ancylobacter dichloromethanicus]|uniref:Tlde1 domain-containing protein n=1 Tax=Ancylobacter dichloromethanicus TaxID=518825 RepID=A0A9W6JB05_9HYPH|nr:DUF2778 domain-containing protein [Ancylobacter dichloromethanicus]MBS7552246.1 DUF2778 domain-containing protein [Ancylobacter dichloromethanicus]GLK73982.1 hypothetical protein GCM10017643_41000 [Ancylobacter dichloromethanicus]